MRRSGIIVLAVLSVVGWWAGGQAYAADPLMSSQQHLRMKVEGTKQGLLKGDVAGGVIICRSLQFDTAASRDVASRLATGPRTASSLAVVKDWGPGTPQLLQALSGNEALKSVVIECIANRGSGPVILYSVKLTNASVSRMRWYSPNPEAPVYTIGQLEEVTFSYGKMEITNYVSGTTALL